MSEYLYQILLLPGQFWVYILTIVTLYHFYSRSMAMRVLYALFLSMSLNAYLKSIFQIPLLPHLGQGWAFPSGHTQSAVVFWLWLAFEFKNKINPLFFIILILIASAGIYLNNFHLIPEITGAYISGFITLIMFFSLKKLSRENDSYLGILSTLISFAFMLMYPKYSNHFGGVVAGLTFCTLSSILINEKQPQVSQCVKTLIVISWLMICLVLYFAFIKSHPSFNEHFVIFSLIISGSFLVIPCVLDHFSQLTHHNKMQK